MVKEIMKYICEFKTCGAEYNSRSEAQRCEDFGFIGPEIKSNFIFRSDAPGHGKYYNITTSTIVEGHRRTTEYRQIYGDLESLKIKEQRFNQKSEEQQKKELQEIDMMDIIPTTTKSLAISLVQGYYKILPKKEFQEVSEFLYNANCMAPYREPWYMGFNLKFQREPFLKDMDTIIEELKKFP
ncbi:MAG: hypothetical protein ABIB43_04860 [archaeon]